MAWQPTPVFLPGESPRTEEPVGLQSVGSQRVGHNWATKHSTHMPYFNKKLKIFDLQKLDTVHKKQQQQLKKSPDFSMFWRQWRGSEQAPPKCVTLAHGWLWAEGNQDAADSRKLLPPLALFFFKYGPLLKSLLNLLEYCFCFVFWLFGCEACGWDLSALLRVWTCTLCAGRPIKRASTRGNFTSEKPAMSQGKHVITRHLLWVLPVSDPPPLWSLRPLSSCSLAQGGL